MTRPRIALAAVMCAVAIAWLYLAVEGDSGNERLHQILWFVTALCWLGFAGVKWQERRAHG